MLKKILRQFYHRNYKFSNPKVLGRVACLGTDVLSLLNLTRALNNHQKSRVDYLIKRNSDSKIAAKSSVVYQYLEKKYIAYCIEDQEKDFFSYEKPQFIFMDSFSELTDQLFINKNDNSLFLANYSDINHSQSFKLNYDCEGLLHQSTILDNYRSFFGKVSEVYPNIPIFFLHFPTSLDSRVAFKDRGLEILRAIDLISGENSFLHSIFIEEELVTKSYEDSDELKDFPYHYGVSTYGEFSDKIVKLLRDKYNYEIG